MLLAPLQGECDRQNATGPTQVLSSAVVDGTRTRASEKQAPPVSSCWRASCQGCHPVWPRCGPVEFSQRASARSHASSGSRLCRSRPVHTIVLALRFCGKNSGSQGRSRIGVHGHDQAGHDPKLSSRQIPPARLSADKVLDEMEDAGAAAL